MNFRYIKGDWKDFYEAPDEAMLLVIDTVGRKHFTDIFPEPGGKYWSELGGHGVWGSAVKPDAFVLIAAREKLDGWDGEVLPPVGCVCEIAGSTPYLNITYPEGAVVKIYSHFTDDRGVELAAFVDKAGKVGGVCAAKCFRPIRSAADKKRDEAIAEMVKRIGITPDSAATCYEICTRID